MATVHEARQALLAGIVDDESGMETFDDSLVDALIAAVRAESAAIFDTALADAAAESRAESAETLRALDTAFFHLFCPMPSEPHYINVKPRCQRIAEAVAARAAIADVGREAVSVEMWEKFTAGEKLAFGMGYRRGPGEARAAALDEARGAVLRVLSGGSQTWAGFPLADAVLAAIDALRASRRSRS